MIVITRKGDLGPVEALQLRDELSRAAGTEHPDVLLDLTEVTAVHPAVAAAIVAGANKVRRQTGQFCIAEPVAAEAQRTLSLVNLSTLLR